MTDQKPEPDTCMPQTPGKQAQTPPGTTLEQRCRHFLKTNASSLGAFRGHVKPVALAGAETLRRHAPSLSLMSRPQRTLVDVIRRDLRYSPKEERAYNPSVQWLVGTLDSRPSSSYLSRNTSYSILHDPSLHPFHSNATLGPRFHRPRAPASAKSVILTSFNLFLCWQLSTLRASKSPLPAR